MTQWLAESDAIRVATDLVLAEAGPLVQKRAGVKEFRKVAQWAQQTGKRNVYDVARDAEVAMRAVQKTGMPGADLGGKVKPINYAPFEDLHPRDRVGRFADKALKKLKPGQSTTLPGGVKVTRHRNPIQRQYTVVGGVSRGARRSHGHALGANDAAARLREIEAEEAKTVTTHVHAVQKLKPGEKHKVADATIRRSDDGKWLEVDTNGKKYSGFDVQQVLNDVRKAHGGYLTKSKEDLPYEGKKGTAKYLKEHFKANAPQWAGQWAEQIDSIWPFDMRGDVLGELMTRFLAEASPALAPLLHSLLHLVAAAEQGDEEAALILQEIGVDYAERLHPRNRRGEWRMKPGVPDRLDFDPRAAYAPWRGQEAPNRFVRAYSGLPGPTSKAEAVGETGGMVVWNRYDIDRALSRVGYKQSTTLPEGTVVRRLAPDLGFRVEGISGAWNYDFDQLDDVLRRAESEESAARAYRFGNSIPGNPMGPVPGVDVPPVDPVGDQIGGMLHGGWVTLPNGTLVHRAPGENGDTFEIIGTDGQKDVVPATDKDATISAAKAAEARTGGRAKQSEMAQFHTTTAGGGPLRPVGPSFVKTRQRLHQVSTQILAPSEQPANEIALVHTPGGFGTPWFTVPSDWMGFTTNGAYDNFGAGTGPSQVRMRVENGRLVRDVRGGRTTTESIPNVNTEDAAKLGEFYNLADSVIGQLKREHPGEKDDPIAEKMGAASILWPEHFDIASEYGDDDIRANYGASPGDESHPEPYFYVGPWAGVGQRDDIWNAASFQGAELPYADVLAAPDQRQAVLDFYRSRFDALAAMRRSTSYVNEARLRREIERTRTALVEARTTVETVRLRARLVAAERQLEESVAFSTRFDERLHPKDRRGRFKEKLHTKARVVRAEARTAGAEASTATRAVGVRRRRFVEKEVDRRVPVKTAEKVDKAAEEFERYKVDDFAHGAEFTAHDYGWIGSHGHDAVHSVNRLVSSGAHGQGHVGKVMDAAHSGGATEHTQGLGSQAVDVLHAAAPHIPNGVQDHALEIANRIVSHADAIPGFMHALLSLVAARQERMTLDRKSDTTAWTRARGREVRAQERLDEVAGEHVLVDLAGPHADALAEALEGSTRPFDLTEASFAERLHPRNRRGEWRDAINVGVTSYVGEGDPAKFRESTRFRSYMASMSRIAGEENLKLRSVDHVEGFWEGHVEPAESVWVDGNPKATERFAMRLGKRYNQDAVMIFEPTDDHPNSVHYTINDVVSEEQAAEFLDMLGAPGGRWNTATRQLDFVDPTMGTAALDKIEAAGLSFEYDFGSVAFPSRPYPPDLAESRRATTAA